MKAAALFASFVIHVAGLLAVPTDSQHTGADRAAPVQQVSVDRAPTCTCDLEITAECPPSEPAR